jgi:hypothetical protein
MSGEYNIAFFKNACRKDRYNTGVSWRGGGKGKERHMAVLLKEV